MNRESLIELVRSASKDPSSVRAISNSPTDRKKWQKCPKFFDSICFGKDRFNPTYGTKKLQFQFMRSVTMVPSARQILLAKILTQSS